MIAGRTVLAIVPARGGSKGIPRKNLRHVAGKPLIAWTIEAARASRYLDRTLISSDDEEILAVAVALGCDTKLKRPAELARDDTPGIKPVLHALSVFPDHDIVVLLQPTSPLRSVQDIDLCLERLIQLDAPSCISVCEAECHPYLAFECLPDHSLSPFVARAGIANMRRQDFPAAWRLNGAVYAARVPWLVETGAFVGSGTIAYCMPAERSVDIDTHDDLALAQSLLERAAPAEKRP